MKTVANPGDTNTTLEFQQVKQNYFCGIKAKHFFPDTCSAESECD